tara:strand:+ start:232 stop:489 length:258 start_codon:yes stop_codon:yes gene_type:complete
MSEEKALTQVNEQRSNLDHRKIKLNTPEFLIRKHATKLGLRAKIDANGIECIYDRHQKGSWQNQVENCTSFDCPLHPTRPTSEGA